MSETDLPMLNDIITGISDKLSTLLDKIGSNSGFLNGNFQNTTDAIKQGLLNGTLDPEEWAEKVGWIKGDNGKYYAPENDPYYNPAGFDFGKATPETQTHTDSSGVQTQSSANTSQAKTAVPAETSQSPFPKTASLKGVYSNLRIRTGAGLNYKVIGSIPPKGKPTIWGESGNWAQVEYNGMRGWSSKDYLTYDKGGLMKGTGIALKDIMAPEAVLSPEQTEAWTKLVDHLTSPELANLIKLPTPTQSDSNSTEYVGDSYTFNNVTIRANDIEEFIASIRGQVPIRNK